MIAPRSLVLDLIEWVAREPKPYDDVMGRWRTSCPRLPVWEDALDAGLVRRDIANGRAVVSATPKGLSLLAQERG